MEEAGATSRYLQGLWTLDLRQVLKYGASIRTGDGKGPDIIGWVDTAR